jgi:hypothetical protein
MGTPFVRLSCVFVSPVRTFDYAFGNILYESYVFAMYPPMEIAVLVVAKMITSSAIVHSTVRYIKCDTSFRGVGGFYCSCDIVYSSKPCPQTVEEHTALGFKVEIQFCPENKNELPPLKKNIRKYPPTYCHNP